MSKGSVDVAGWLREQDEWIQVLAEKIMNNKRLDESAVFEVVVALKKDKRESSGTNDSAPLILRENDTVTDLRLCSVGDIAGIDQLAPRTPLVFSDELTVVYGRNGSGKSGYTRILKKICGKLEGIDLKGNVFLDPPSQQSCNLKYSIDGKVKDVEFNTKGGHIEDLAGLDVFDADTGNSYLLSENEAAYSPKEVAFFEELAAGFNLVKSALQSEKAGIRSKLPDIPTSYLTSEFYKKVLLCLKERKTKAELKNLLDYSTTEDKKLIALYDRVKGDPAQALKAKKRERNGLKGLIEQLCSAGEALKSEKLRALEGLKAKYEEKKEAAGKGLAVLQNDSLIEGVGTDTWKALWEAARSFVEKKQTR